MSAGRVRWSRILAAIVLVGVVAGVPAIRGAVLRAVGRILVVDDPVGPADIIVVPQWAGPSGAIEAADLVHSGVAGRVALLPEPAKPAERELVRRGVPYLDEIAEFGRLMRALGVATIEVVPDAAEGTEAQGRVLLAWCDQRQFRSIVVVSAADHARRVRRVLHRSLQGRSTHVVIRSARFSTFDPDRWWQTRDGIRIGLTELQKLLLDVARHPFS